MVAARTDIASKLKMIAWALALYNNVESGRCDPSYKGLPEQAGVSERDLFARWVWLCGRTR
jgi:hypothetical protein